eukprot:GHVL01031927.1.p1 GENE.GHVL01031927.1~~GHVL01031927.1.p1  ORF type:complete len:340 (+),score=48.86 GHVL01031927.1:26-1045(+)
MILALFYNVLVCVVCLKTLMNEKAYKKLTSSTLPDYSEDYHDKLLNGSPYPATSNSHPATGGNSHLPYGSPHPATDNSHLATGGNSHPATGGNSHNADNGFSVGQKRKATSPLFGGGKMQVEYLQELTAEDADTMKNQFDKYLPPATAASQKPATATSQKPATATLQPATAASQPATAASQPATAALETILQANLQKPATATLLPAATIIQPFTAALQEIYLDISISKYENNDLHNDLLVAKNILVLQSDDSLDSRSTGNLEKPNPKESARKLARDISGCLNRMRMMPLVQSKICPLSSKLASPRPSGFVESGRAVNIWTETNLDDFFSAEDSFCRRIF